MPSTFEALPLASSEKSSEQRGEKKWKSLFVSQPAAAPSDAGAAHLPYSEELVLEDTRGGRITFQFPESASCSRNASHFCIPPQTEDQKAVKACRCELLMRREGGRQ